MPKTVSKASDTSRSGYQKGYQLGNRGGATPKGSGPTAAASVKGESTAKLGSGRTGGRQKKLGSDDGGGGINVSYGETLPIGELQEVADFGKGTKPGKALKLGKALDYAKEKGDKGSGFNYRKRR
jgi:hypothetical protein